MSFIVINSLCGLDTYMHLWQQLFHVVLYKSCLLWSSDTINKETCKLKCMTNKHQVFHDKPCKNTSMSCTLQATTAAGWSNVQPPSQVCRVGFIWLQWQPKLWVLYWTLDALKRCRGSHCPFRSFKLCSSRNATGTALHYTNSSFWSHTRWPANSF